MRNATLGFALLVVLLKIAFTLNTLVNADGAFTKNKLVVTPEKDDELVFVQFHLRKAGGRTIVCTLTSRNTSYFQYVSGKKSGYPDVKTYVSEGHHLGIPSMKIYRQWKSDPNTFLFTVMRHPIKRVLSTFSTALGRKVPCSAGDGATFPRVSSKFTTKTLSAGVNDGDLFLKVDRKDYFNFDDDTNESDNIDKILWGTSETDKLNLEKQKLKREGKSKNSTCCMVGHLFLCDDAIAAVKRGSMTLQQFASIVETEPSMNYQSKSIAQIDYKKHANTSPMHIAMAPEFHGDENLLLSTALTASEKVMDLIMIADRFNESLAVMSCIVEERSGHKLQNVNICANYNPHKDESELEEDMAEAMELLEMRNRVDMQFFKWANKILDLQIARHVGKQCYERVISSLKQCHTPPHYVDKFRTAVNGPDPIEVFSKAKALLEGTVNNKKTISSQVIKQINCPIQQANVDGLSNNIGSFDGGEGNDTEDLDEIASNDNADDDDDGDD
eukprot:m.140912 g.140912  ORF g.140912 m.140912 type:complete len:500 (-) comp34836_c0_seq1:16-1515(-)